VKEFHGRRQLLPNRMPVQQQPFGSAGASPSQGGPTSTSSGMAWSANTRQLTLAACLWGGATRAEALSLPTKPVGRGGRCGVCLVCAVRLFAIQA
jgi:hypothetical protein